LTCPGDVAALHQHTTARMAKMMSATTVILAQFSFACLHLPKDASSAFPLCSAKYICFSGSSSFFEAGKRLHSGPHSFRHDCPLHSLSTTNVITSSNPKVQHPPEKIRTGIAKLAPMSAVVRQWDHSNDRPVVKLDFVSTGQPIPVISITIGLHKCSPFLTSHMHKSSFS
jgi:hypothetical protein